MRRASRSTLVIELPPPSTRISLDGDHYLRRCDLLLGQPLLFAQPDQLGAEQRALDDRTLITGHGEVMCHLT